MVTPPMMATTADALIPLLPLLDPPSGDAVAPTSGSSCAVVEICVTSVDDCAIHTLTHIANTTAAISIARVIVTCLTRTCRSLDRHAIVTSVFSRVYRVYMCTRSQEKTNHVRGVRFYAHAYTYAFASTELVHMRVCRVHGLSANLYVSLCFVRRPEMPQQLGATECSLWPVQLHHHI